MIRYQNGDFENKDNLTSRDLYFKMRYTMPLRDLCYKHCPTMTRSMSSSTHIEKMYELIKLRDYCNSSKNYDEIKNQQTDIIRFIMGNMPLRIENKASSRLDEWEIGDMLTLFYKEEPTYFSYQKLRDDSKTQDLIEYMVIIQKEKNDQYDSKIKLLEQYQASLLDKISVFTEMIDELQKK